MRTISIYLFLVASIIYLTGCNDDPVNTTQDYSAALENIATNVILETYLVLNERTEQLTGQIQSFQANPNATTLNGARTFWRAARLPWERSEGFLFGPVDQQGIDPAIDSWPVNETDLNAVLNSGQALTKNYLDGLDGTLKGFHTIEYLLWGTDGQKEAGDFTLREMEYLVAAAQSLQGATQQLYSSWDPAAGNFISNILLAGKTGSIYPSEKAALQEIVNGMIVIADEVGNGKINDPFVQQDLTLEESRFSSNSKEDFTDNIRSIYNVYVGEFIHSGGLGISSIVHEQDTTLDAHIQSQIEEAILAILAIEGSFTTAIFDSPATVQNAQTKVRDLQQTLESQLLPLITNL